MTHRAVESTILHILAACWGVKKIYAVPCPPAYSSIKQLKVYCTDRGQVSRYQLDHIF